VVVLVFNSRNRSVVSGLWKRIMQYTQSRDQEISMQAMVAASFVLFIIGNLALAVDPTMPAAFLEGQLTIIQVFIIAALSGLGGTWVGLATFGSDCVKDLARQGIGNFGLSVIAGPSTAYWISSCTGAQMNLFLVVPVAAAWGIGGAFLLKKVGPKIIDMMASRAEREGQRIFGGDTPRGEK
jgi:hypothetical protein